MDNLGTTAVTRQPSPWPSSEDYMLAHRCTRCGAGIGQRCNEPNKPDYPWHAARQDAGIRHYMRDVGQAPWPEDREPRARYDTLPEADSQ